MALFGLSGMLVASNEPKRGWILYMFTTLYLSVLGTWLWGTIIYAETTVSEGCIFSISFTGLVSPPLLLVLSALFTYFRYRSDYSMLP